VSSSIGSLQRSAHPRPAADLGPGNLGPWVQSLHLVRIETPPPARRRRSTIHPLVIPGQCDRIEPGTQGQHTSRCILVLDLTSRVQPDERKLLAEAV